MVDRDILSKVQDWTDIAAKAQTKLINSIPSEWRIQLPPDDRLDVTGIPRECGLLTETELKITESYATEIVGAVAAGEWTAEEVTRAFCKRAAVAHQVTNCLTIIMFDEAIAQAKKLDDHFSRTGQTVGPLHGLPISLKDNFNIAGKPSSVGFCAWALEPCKSDSTIVSLLRSLGAIAYVKTNVPVAMMIAESVNNCYGRTVNPLSRALTSGGSSGGESALIAMCGSPLGVGTDIGGSLRIPAACTGIYTIRPSYGRFPHFDARTGMAGQEAVGSVHGPMARSLADIRLWCESVVGACPWLQDPKCIELPWRPVTLPQKLKIAVLWDNGIVTPTPPVQLALKETVAALRAAGHEIIDWPATDHAEALSLLAQFFVADGGRSIRSTLEAVSEPFRPEMRAYEVAEDKGVYNLWQLQTQRTDLAKRYLDRWNSVKGGLDAILSPTTPYAAPKNGEFRNVSYTGVYNIMDYSCVSFPSGTVAEKERDVYGGEAGKFGGYGTDDEVTKKEYDAEAVHGMPVSLQLVGRKLQEERMLAVAEKVLEALGK